MTFAQKQAFRVVKGFAVSLVLTVLLAGIALLCALLYVIIGDFLHSHYAVVTGRWAIIIAGFWFMGYLWDTRLRGYVVMSDAEIKHQEYLRRVEEINRDYIERKGMI